MSERLNEVVKTCQKRGATVHGIPIDINIEQLSGELDRYFDRFPIDLLIANAGNDLKDFMRYLFVIINNLPFQKVKLASL